MVNVTYGGLVEAADGSTTLNPLGTDYITTLGTDVAGELSHNDHGRRVDMQLSTPETLLLSCYAVLLSFSW